MIPKIIHYGLFGGWQMSALNQRCLSSWQRVLPDYEIRLWTDDNGPTDQRFFRDALRLKPVNASNFIKFWALFHVGGVFLDNDVEMVRPFDLSPAAFVGFQRADSRDGCINGAVMGAVKGHGFIGDCLRAFDTLAGDVWPTVPGCALMTERLYALGMTGLNVAQQVGDVTVYGTEKFYPWRWDEPPDWSRVTDQTVAVHHWEGSWTKTK